MKIAFFLCMLLTLHPHAFCQSPTNAVSETNLIQFHLLPIAGISDDEGLIYGIMLSMDIHTNQSQGLNGHIDLKLKSYADFTSLFKSFIPTLEIELQPSFANFHPRLYSKLCYYINRYTPYYGTNNDAAIDPTLRTNFYYRYKIINPYWRTFLFLPLFDDIALKLNLLAGISLGNTEILPSPILPSGGITPKLQAEQPFGYAGGFDLSLLAGAQLDTRKDSENPAEGSYSEALAEYSSRSIGSTYDYNRITLIQTLYFRPFSSIDRLILAGRIIGDVLFGSPPFYKEQVIGGIKPLEALGGDDTLRGLPTMRYTGMVKLLISPEIRYNIFEWTGDYWLIKGDFALSGALYCDIGGAWKDLTSIDGTLHVGVGAGLRIMLLDSFTLSGDLAFSEGNLSGTLGGGQQF